MRIRQGLCQFFCSPLGTSTEGADCGQVGWGNNGVNGLIALSRLSGNEAAAGKNAVSHVAKIYNLLTHRMADEIYKRIQGVSEV